MAHRSVSTWLIVIVSFVAGAGAGAFAERAYVITRIANAGRMRVDRAVQRRQFDSAMTEPRRRELDSLFQARRNTPVWSRPLEVRRVQAGANCAVSYVMQDTSFRNFPLFWAETADRVESPAPRGRNPREPLARAYTYRAEGWNVGDTATVVLADVWCGGLGMIGAGGSVVYPPAPVGVDQR